MNKTAVQVAAGTLLSYPALAQTITNHAELPPALLAAIISIGGQLILKLGTTLIEKIKHKNLKRTYRRKFPAVDHSKKSVEGSQPTTL